MRSHDPTPHPALNRVLLSGRLASEPQLLVTDIAGSVCLLRLECSPRWPAPQTASDGDREPLRFDVLILGSAVEKVAPYLYEGRTVVVDGSLESASWESEGPREREGVCVLAHRVEFIGPPPAGIAAARDGQDADTASVPVGYSEDVWL
jgi:single-stranded DNA-binding protein